MVLVVEDHPVIMVDLVVLVVVLTMEEIQDLELQHKDILVVVQIHLQFTEVEEVVELVRLVSLELLLMVDLVVPVKQRPLLDIQYH
jgi:hypothetical protein